nr:hypothetical protein BaRGS_013164 [Batillaria attramentaria]
MEKELADIGRRVVRKAEQDATLVYSNFEVALPFSVFCDSQRGFEVEEGESDTIWSYRSSSTSNVTWTVRSPDGKVIELGSCRAYFSTVV